MAYGEKYYHEYCDRYGNTYRVSLRLKDYSGPALEQDAMTTPFKIERELPAGIKKGGVLGTKATAYFLSKGLFTLSELYTAQEDTYQLVRLKNGIVNWIGFVVPDGFKENNFDAERTVLEVSATDNLSTLTGKQFVDMYGDNYGQANDNMQTFLWVVKEILKKTGILLPIKTLVDLKTKESAQAVIRQYRVGSFLGEMHFEFVGDKQGALDFEALAVPGSTLTVTQLTGLTEKYTVVSARAASVGTVTHSVFVKVTTTYYRPYSDVKVQIEPPAGSPGVPTGPANYEDPLAVTVHDVRVWVRDSNEEGRSYYEVRGGAFSSYDVLEYIASQWNFIVYQNEGHWVVKRWNVDRADTSEYKWFVYTSEGVLTGRAPYKSPVSVPCVPTKDVFRVYGTTAAMDRVFKHVITNYRYKYRQEGDSLINLLNNGNLDGSFNPMPNKWRYYGISDQQNSGSVRPTRIERVTGGLPPGVQQGMRVFGRARHNYVSNLTEQTMAAVNSGDRLMFTWFERVDGVPSGNAVSRSFYGTFCITLYDSLDYALQDHGINRGVRAGYRQNYDLINNKSMKVKDPARNDDPYVGSIELGASWFDPVDRSDTSRGGSGTFLPVHRFTVPERGIGSRGADASVWQKVTVITDPVPMTGVVSFAVVGVSCNQPYNVPFLTATHQSTKAINPVTGAQSTLWFIKDSGADRNIGMVVAQLTMSKIVDPDNEVVPLVDPFMYPSFEDQVNRNYTDVPEEIVLLTGDDYGDLAEDRLSSMWYKGSRTTMWDSWDERFGWSRQGLITAKSVIEMYWTPRRLITCEIHLPNISWDTVFAIEELPGILFGILRGEIAGSQDSFRGVLTEVYGSLDEALPPGGEDGGNTTKPEWALTGVTRCVKDATGKNTGIVEGVQRDINAASQTYGQERWVSLGRDNDTCPLGETVAIFWGESTSTNPDTLRYFPYTKIDNVYSVTFKGDNSNKLLRLLHRADLGQVREVSYVDGENSLGAWRYENDVVLSGTVYKSLKLEWVVGIFNDLNVNFEIY